MSTHPPELLDCVIVGGGPAGLSTALILGRCRRNVLVCDAGQPRNAASRSLHGFLTRDGIQPAELLRIGREQLDEYPNVEFRSGTVTDAKCLDARSNGALRRKVGGGFEVTIADQAPVRSRILCLATGVKDVLPKVPGIEDFYGISIFHCPYCDGWEMRDQPLAVYGCGKGGGAIAEKMLAWTNDLVVCTDGHEQFDQEQSDRLAELSVPVISKRIARLEGANGHLEQIIFEDGQRLSRKGMFIQCKQTQRSDLACRLGCRVDDYGAPVTGEDECTDVPGLFVVGDASRDLQLAIVAAAEGATAAFAIHEALIEADRNLELGLHETQSEADQAVLAGPTDN